MQKLLCPANMGARWPGAAIIGAKSRLAAGAEPSITSMATLIVQVKLHDGCFQDYGILEAAMINENFIPRKSAAPGYREFLYYGNLGLSPAHALVKKTVLQTGRQFSFAVLKDQGAEKQYHNNNNPVRELSAPLRNVS